ncbi:MAG: hypothetical protein M0Z84_04495 [Gammaproteobacteria bacterium]|nr:hypothetical protein [Gammaproteobacteria bacterium]
MKKLLRLIFGDIRNIISVGAAIALAYAVQRWAPDAAGWALVAALLAAGFWQAAG